MSIFLSCFQNVLNAIKDKFVLPDSNELDTCDDTNTVIEEDFFFNWLSLVQIYA